jgi:hypothetical protein
MAGEPVRQARHAEGVQGIGEVWVDVEVEELASKL